MAFDWPEFLERVQIDEARGWTATFDSYRQYTEDCFYLVNLCEADGTQKRFIVQIPVGWAGDDWTGPSFEDYLRQAIGAAAAAGETNCEYGRFKEKWGTLDRRG
jgi:hypothetical protein